MSLKISTLQTFVAVAECGKLSDAAARLHRTPSAVSMALRSLEQHLGRPLFEAERKSRLTPLGRYVLEQARAGIRHFDRTAQAIEQYARNEAGTLAIACTPTAATRILPRVLKTFARRWPGVAIDVRDMDSRSVLNELDGGRVDLGIATPLPQRSGFESQALVRDPFGVICSRRHALVRREAPLDWSDLAGCRFIANPICALIPNPAFQAIVAASRLTVRNTTSILALVAAGVGITVLPQLALAGAGSGVRFLPLRQAGLVRELHVIQRAGSNATPAAEAFVAALLHDCAGG